MKYWTWHGIVTVLVWLLILAGAICWGGREYGLW